MRVRIFPCLSLLLLLSSTVTAQEVGRDKERMEAFTRELAKGEAIELRALEIRARIYEPSVIYILDRARLDVDYDEESVRFTPRIEEPILENRF